MESGTNFDTAAASSFEAGVATRAEVEARLGAPQSVTTGADGSSIIVYTHVESRANSLSGKSEATARSVAYRFDAAGVLQQTSTQNNTARSQ
jgi:hypothetical protein